MDKITAYIIQNPIMAIVGAAVLIFLAGIASRHFKIVAIVFILAASFIFYILLKADKIGKIKIDDIKQKVKTKVIQNM